MATWGERVDAAIDDAARRMTEGEPAADFTARVMDRVAEESAHRSRSAWTALWRDARRHGWNPGWVLSPVAAAAVLAIAIVLFRGAGHEQRASREPGPGSGGIANASQPAGAAAGPKGPALRPKSDVAGENARAAGGPNGPALRPKLDNNGRAALFDGRRPGPFGPGAEAVARVDSS